MVRWCLSGFPPTLGPDCVALSRNNTTDGLSRFWVAQHLTFIMQSNELELSIIPAINCLPRSLAKFKWGIIFSLIDWWNFCLIFLIFQADILLACSSPEAGLQRSSRDHRCQPTSSEWTSQTNISQTERKIEIQARPHQELHRTEQMSPAVRWYSQVSVLATNGQSF